MAMVHDENALPKNANVQDIQKLHASNSEKKAAVAQTIGRKRTALSTPALQVQGDDCAAVAVDESIPLAPPSKRARIDACFLRPCANALVEYRNTLVRGVTGAANGIFAGAQGVATSLAQKLRSTRMGSSISQHGDDTVDTGGATSLIEADMVSKDASGAEKVEHHSKETPSLESMEMKDGAKENTMQAAATLETECSAKAEQPCDAIAMQEVQPQSETSNEMEEDDHALKVEEPGAAQEVEQEVEHRQASDSNERENEQVAECEVGDVYSKYVEAGVGQQEMDSSSMTGECKRQDNE